MTSSTSTYDRGDNRECCETGKALFYPKRTSVVLVPKPVLCGQCKKPVFAAETVSAAGKKYHKLCLKCSSCSRLLDSSTLTEHKDSLFCKTCYSKLFGLDALRFRASICGNRSHAKSTENTLKTFEKFSDDRKPAVVEQYETNNCHHSLPTITTESNLFPKKDVQSLNSSAQSWASLPSQSSSYDKQTKHSSTPKIINYHDELKISTITQKILNAQQSDRCVRCNGRVYLAERITMCGQHFHKLCFKCNDCKTSLSPGNYCDNSNGGIFCKGCYTKKFGPVGIGRGIRSRPNTAV